MSGEGAPPSAAGADPEKRVRPDTLPPEGAEKAKINMPHIQPGASLGPDDIAYQDKGSAPSMFHYIYDEPEPVYPMRPVQEGGAAAQPEADSYKALYEDAQSQLSRLTASHQSLSERVAALQAQAAAAERDFQAQLDSARTREADLTSRNKFLSGQITKLNGQLSAAEARLSQADSGAMELMELRKRVAELEKAQDPRPDAQ
jgi:hypothetical protein